MTEVVSIVACLLVYWLLIRGTTRLSIRTRIALVAVYGLLHITSWALMHSTVRRTFCHRVNAIHADALAGIDGQVAPLRESEGGEFDEGEVRQMKSHLYAHPRWRLRSFAPTPGVLISYEEYSIGLLWGRGDMLVYIFNGTGVMVLWKEWRWVS